jgi:hypothetical protein
MKGAAEQCFFLYVLGMILKKDLSRFSRAAYTAGLSDIYKLRAAEAAAKLLNNFKRKEYILFSR